jgi:hypothetical protein
MEMSIKQLVRAALRTRRLWIYERQPRDPQTQIVGQMPCKRLYLLGEDRALADFIDQITSIEVA